MISYLGPEGSFTHQALLLYFKNKNPELLSSETITQAIDFVNNGRAQMCVVPIENSIEGSVGETLDRLINSSQKVTIQGEIILPIEHCLISKSKKLNDIKKVYAHIQALNQCQGFLKRFLPNASQESTPSNSYAVKLLQDMDETNCAIGPKISAEIYNIPIVELGINDEKENFTRFVIIGTETKNETGNDKTTIAFGVPYDKPGTLVKVLSAFANEKINLTRIESRPSRKALGEYIFYIDLCTHKENSSFKKALSEIASEFSFYRWLGSYPL